MTSQTASPTSLIDSAVRHHHAGRLDEADALYRRILADDPDNPDALHLLGVIHLQKGDPGVAVDLISHSLSANPQNYNALNHLGEAYRALHLLDEAMTCFERALNLKSDFYQAYTSMGNVYQARARLDLAAACYRKSLEISPEYAEAHANLANATLEQGNTEEAIAGYRRSLELRPNAAIVLFNLGNAYKILRRYDEAIDVYRKAIALNAGLIVAHLALARAFHESGEREKAIAQFERACEIAPENAEARWGLAFTKLALVHDDRAQMREYRAEFAQDLDQLDKWFDAKRTENAYSAVGSHQPFYLAYHEENNRDLLMRYGALCNRIAVQWQHQQTLTPRKARRRPRVRLGVVSAHIRDHSVWHALIKGWCEQLDDTRVELHLFFVGTPHDSETDVARALIERFEEGGRPLVQWARTILERELDVLIYPEIGIDATAAKLASLRLAPVQAVAWGHPETSGLPAIDYYISAEDFEPEGAHKNYTEHLVCLPHLGCYYRPKETANMNLDIGGLGIDPSRPVLVCPGAPFKYAPQHDRVLIDIAKRVGHSQLVLLKYPLEGIFRQLARRLERAFDAAGLDYQRHVVEIPWLTPPAFSSLMRQADVYLDTIGFSGFNTAMQAIEAGLPIVAIDGQFMRGRLASGILKRLGMPELVASSDETYVDLAVALIENDERRARLRTSIEQNRASLLGDTAPLRTLEAFLGEATSAART